MNEDDDEPPMLVVADGTDPAEATLSAEMEDVQIARVPITIITGTKDLNPWPCRLRD